MEDYLVVVENIGNRSESILIERYTDVSEDFIEGVLVGLNLVYPDNEIYKEEIKKVKR